MKPEPKFLNQSPEFWADVRTISELCGYTRKTKDHEPLPASLPKAKRKLKTTLGIPSITEIGSHYKSSELTTEHIFDSGDSLTDYGQRLLDYFKSRSESLQEISDNQLMDAEEAKTEYERLLADSPHVVSPQPMNKQKDAMKAPAFLTATKGFVSKTCTSKVVHNFTSPGTCICRR